MKNFLLIIAFSFCFLVAGTSQVSFGAGATYWGDFGVQARASIEMEKLNLIPKFSYYFVDNVTQMAFDVDAAFDIATISDQNPLYVFGGPSLYRLSASGFSNSELGLNFGVGTQISNLYIEAKYGFLLCDGCSGDIGFAAGYMF
jgi:hypothetical protein